MFITHAIRFGDFIGSGNDNILINESAIKVIKDLYLFSPTKRMFVAKENCES